MLTLAGWASVALIIIAVVNLLLLAGLVYMVFMLRDQVRKLRMQAQPVISEAQATVAMVRQQAQPVMAEIQATLGNVKQVTNDVSLRVEQISERVTNMTNEVTRRAEQLSGDITSSVDRITDDMTGSIDRITNTSTQRFEQVTADLTNRVENIGDLGERLADRILERLDTTSAIIEQAVGRPLVGLASVRAGINKGLEAWRDFRREGNGRGPQEQTMEQETARRMVEQMTSVPQGEDFEG